MQSNCYFRLKNSQFFYFLFCRKPCIGFGHVLFLPPDVAGCVIGVASEAPAASFVLYAAWGTSNNRKMFRPSVTSLE